MATMISIIMTDNNNNYSSEMGLRTWDLSLGMGVIRVSKSEDREVRLTWARLQDLNTLHNHQL